MILYKVGQNYMSDIIRIVVTESFRLLIVLSKSDTFTNTVIIQP